jgi:hypothetical protein
MALYFPQADATFIHIPKTGGTMMRYWGKTNIPDKMLEGSCPRYPDVVVDRHWQLDKIKEVWPNPGTIFTFVRNPYDRLVSHFFWSGQVAKKRLDEKYNYYFEKSIVYDILEYKSMEKGFDRYVRKLYNKEYSDIWFDKWRYEKGWTRADTQASWLVGGKVDIIIKLEEIESKFCIIQDLLGCTAPFPKVALNASQHDHYSTYYTLETKAMVAEMFQEDFEQFGYDIE